MLHKPKIIGISGVAAAGKSTLIRALGDALHATVIFWDDYEHISQEPVDYATWFKSDRNYDAWKYDALENTLRELKSGKAVKCPATGKMLQPTKYIVLEAPLGRKHTQTGQYIDILIFVDIDPDIALARRILREYQGSKNIDDVFNDLNQYLTSSRSLYLWSHEAKKDADIIVDGSMPIDTQVQTVLSNMKSYLLFFSFLWQKICCFQCFILW